MGVRATARQDRPPSGRRYRQCHLPPGRPSRDIVASCGSRPARGLFGGRARLLPGAALVRARDQLPFVAGAFDSATMLDVLEHTADERVTLAEVPCPSPGRPADSDRASPSLLHVLDPDNVKFRLPDSTERCTRHASVLLAITSVSSTRLTGCGATWRGTAASTRTIAPKRCSACSNSPGSLPSREMGRTCSGASCTCPRCLDPFGLSASSMHRCELDSRLFSRANLFLTAVRDDEP